MKKVAIIIVNWNGIRLLKACLDSVNDLEYKNFEIYFVDNGSTDNSVKFVKDNYKHTKIITLDKNTGFARGNNIGILEAFKDNQVEYIVTLNNDTVVDKFFLSELVNIAELEDSIGSVAPKMKFLFEKNMIDSVGILIHSDGGGVSRGNKENDSGQYDNQDEIFGTCGGASLYKRKMLEDIQYKNEFFDEDFFAYYEDLDLAWRARLKNWISIASPRALVRHVHSATSVSFSPFKSFYVNRNRFFVIIKNYPLIYLIQAFFLTPMRYIRLINSIRIKKGPSYNLSKNTNKLTPIVIVLKGWLSVMSHLPKMLVKRAHIMNGKKIDNQIIHEWFEKYSATIEDMIYK